MHRPRVVVINAYINDRYAAAHSGLEYIPVGVDPAWVRGVDCAVVRQRHDIGDAPVVLFFGHVIPCGRTATRRPESVSLHRSRQADPARF